MKKWVNPLKKVSYNADKYQNSTQAFWIVPINIRHAILKHYLNAFSNRVWFNVRPISDIKPVVVSVHPNFLCLLFSTRFFLSNHVVSVKCVTEWISVKSWKLNSQNFIFCCSDDIATVTVLTIKRASAGCCDKICEFIWSIN